MGDCTHSPFSFHPPTHPLIYHSYITHMAVIAPTLPVFTFYFSLFTLHLLYIYTTLHACNHSGVAPHTVHRWSSTEYAAILYRPRRTRYKVERSEMTLPLWCIINMQVIVMINHLYGNAQQQELKVARLAMVTSAGGPCGPVGNNSWTRGRVLLEIFASGGYYEQIPCKSRHCVRSLARSSANFAGTDGHTRGKCCTTYRTTLAALLVVPGRFRRFYYNKRASIVYSGTHGAPSAARRPSGVSQHRRAHC